LNTWNYRVIVKNGRYAIHEVYYDKEGEPWTCTEDPVCPEAETLDALREDMEYYRLALERPVLEYADLVPDYDPSAPDIEESF
jgi:hypothetical protein